LGFYDGVPDESDISKFINKMGADLDTCFIHLLEFIHENISIDGITEVQIIGFLQNNDRVGIRIKTGKRFTGYSQKKKLASTHWAGMTLILDALWSWYHKFDRKYPGERERKGLSHASDQSYTYCKDDHWS